MHKYVIFAIDNNSSAVWVDLFERTFENHIKRTGSLVHCQGYWEGIAEKSYICNRADFEAIVEAGGWVSGQECVLAVTGSNKMYAQLEYPCGKIEQVGSMHSVTREEAEASIGYTYRPDINAYWVAKQGNPDNSYRESAARRDAGLYDQEVAA